MGWWRRLVGLIALFTILVPTAAQAGQLSANDLKAMIEQMGYATSTLSQPDQALKFQIDLATAQYNIPVALEVSPSGRKIWVTALLGSAGGMNGAKAFDLLKANGSVQPAQFYVTPSDNLMYGLVIDNRDVSTEEIRLALDKIKADIDNFAPIWNR